MSIVKILQYPDTRLKRVAQKVEDFGAEFQRYADTMFQTHYAADNCAALAATQLDLNPGYHVTVIDFSAEHDQPLCIVNGDIIAREGEQNEEEGCMSVGCDVDVYLHAKVKRAMNITLRYQDRHGEVQEMQAEGFMAKCIQHELDHLDGKIYLDRLSTLKRKMLEKKLNKELRSRERD
jgi:peptide deformylase